MTVAATQIVSKKRRKRRTMKLPMNAPKNANTGFVRAAIAGFARRCWTFSEVAN